MSSQLAVGFDLDMTLIDTVPGFAAVLRVLGAELGVEFPIEELTSKLGPPLDQILAPHLAADAIGPAGDRFRALYPDHAIARRPRAAGRARGPRSRTPPPRPASSWSPASTRPTPSCTSTTSASTSTSSRAGSGASARPRCCGARAPRIYVGDHVHDVEGARAAGALSVSVLTGGCTREELEEAGTDVVLET